jgi:Glycosyl hydrolases family 43/Carbohydrate binding module (family 6)
MDKDMKLCITIVIFLMVIRQAAAQNPFVRDQFTADPSARVFGDRVYVFPSHDILANQTRGRMGWFCMEDYHVFSSANLTDWKDHGVIVKQNEVPWVRKDSYSMWAPDCIERNGKYYFYFPTAPKDTTAYGKGFTVGVAVADKPEGPYVSQAIPIKGVRGIDPNVFIDKDGQAYLYWSARNIYGARLKDNMLELAEEPKILSELPEKGLKEGPFLFEKNGVYYLTYPHVENKIERLEYATGNNPLGPFKFAGVIMDESPTGCWTNHHSIIPFKNQWYLFYHHNDYSPKFDKARSVRVDSLFFNGDGSIKKVTPTLRGVGFTDARQQIQLDRYSSIQGASISFLDSLSSFKGWKTVFDVSDSWVQYNRVDFGKKSATKVTVRAMSAKGGTLQIRADGMNGPVLAEIKIPEGKDWGEVKASVSKSKHGVHHVVVISKGAEHVAVDWISFE